ncbi:MAG: sugar ABC transporter substrate-binding protein [Dorea sp.]|nr:sugar ABC transporter substrate-binding protein [Dorea sp.]
MKKKLISMLLAGTMVLSLAACGGGGSTGGDSGDGGDDAGSAEMGTSDDENTLTVAAWDPNFNIPALEAAAADYKENVNSDFVLDIKEQGGSQDVETAITTAASSGKYETLPDMVLFQDHWIQKFVADYPDAWQNVDDIDINWDDFYAEKIDYSTIDGVHYGVPVDGGTVIMAYRVDLLEEAGYTIDDMKGITWEKFIEVGKAVKEKTGKALLCMNSDGNDLMYMMLQAEGVSQFKDGKPNLVGNDKVKEIVQLVVDMVNEGVLLLPNSWSDYTDKAIQGDQVAGVMNGNWIIPTIQAVDANSGKWEITTMPTLTGEEGYASNGGSSLYITANCKKVDLAKDFLAYTFGKSTVTYDNALKDGGVVSTYIPAGESEVYNEGVEFFNNTPIYAQISEMGAHVQTIEQSPFHYTCREKLGAAVINIVNGGDIDEEIQGAEDQLNFEMGN